MKDRVEIDSREKKSAKKRVAVRSTFSEAARQARPPGKRRMQCEIRPRLSRSRARCGAAFSTRPAGAAGRSCWRKAARNDYSMHDRASKYPQIFPNFL
ncbi:hypothetical protein [Burkholderia oklahomensis]|uniref:hypothetical protein n=1 Tax=Burkholderia oklahomensis TaxID=342113 RepID=UPI00016A7EC9|nr:hypothetical protein [Burkholderia oklahomensis]